MNLLPDEADSEDGPTVPPAAIDDDNGDVGLPSQIENILELVPEERRPQASLMISKYVAQYSGPVPHSGEMERFKAIDPSFPERFMQMAERQSEHRQVLEKQVVSEEARLKLRGQLFAMISVVVILLFAFALALIGATTVAGIVGGTTVVGVVSIFVAGRYLAKSEVQDSSGGDD